MGMLDNFKKRRGTVSNSLTSAMEDKQYVSEFYYPERDQQGAASVVIRFLPQKDPDAVPFVSLYRHAFKGDDGNWVITDLCATSIGKDCEICKCNSVLWNTNIKEKQDIARERKRKKEYICNILVVKDPKSPEKEGKVFPYRFGPSIYNKIKQAIKPSFEDEPVLNPFDLWEGADFMLRIRKDPQSKQVTYDDSKFCTPSELFNGDEKKLEDVISQCIDLSKYVDPALVAGQNELAKRCEKAYANCIPQNKSRSENTSAQVSAPKQDAHMPEFPETTNTASSSADEDALKSFQSLVNNIDEVPF